MLDQRIYDLAERSYTARRAADAADLTGELEDIKLRLGSPPGPILQRVLAAGPDHMRKRCASAAEALVTAFRTRPVPYYDALADDLADALDRLTRYDATSLPNTIWHFFGGTAFANPGALRVRMGGDTFQARLAGLAIAKSSLVQVAAEAERDARAKKRTSPKVVGGVIVTAVALIAGILAGIVNAHTIASWFQSSPHSTPTPHIQPTPSSARATAPTKDQAAPRSSASIPPRPHP